jgi:hypothetical protein
MRKKFKSPFSFRQTQKFKNDNGKISFSLFVFKTENYQNEKTIEIKAKLIKNSALRHLEEFIPAFIDCSTSSTSNDPLELDCSTNGDSDAAGVIILDSDDLTGIPSNETLSNPALVDSLIQDGVVKDCSSDSCSLTVFSNTQFSDSVRNNGTIYVTGDIDGTIPDGSIFNLSIYPDSYGDCNITLDSKKIECFNKEEIDIQPILIEEATVKNLNGTDLFRLKGGVKSDDDDLSCAINENLHSLSYSQGGSNATPIIETTLTTQIEPEPIPGPQPGPEPTSSPNNGTIPYYYYRKNNSSGGLSGGAIAAIILSILAALIALIVLTVVCKSNSGGTAQKHVVAPLENSDNFQNSVVKFKTPV